MRGDAAAFEAFVGSRGTALLRTAVLLCAGDRAAGEDLLQDVLARVSRRWSGVQTDPEAYVRAALANAAADRSRRSRRRVREQAPDPAAEPEYPDSDHAERIAVRHELLSALASLPARQRAVVVLRHVEDLSEAETATALGISVGTVKSHASRGLAHLRLALETTASQTQEVPRER